MITDFFDLIKFTIIGIVLLLIFLSIFSEFQTSSEIKEYCKNNGINYKSKAPSTFIGRDFNLLNVPTLTTFDCYFDYMEGNKSGYDYVLLSYTYHLPNNSGKMSVFHNTVCILKEPNLNLPKFLTYSRTRNDLFLTARFSETDINLESQNILFHDRFVMQGTQRVTIEDFFNSKICQIFLDNGSSYCYYEGGGQNMVFLVPQILEIKD